MIAVGAAMRPQSSTGRHPLPTASLQNLSGSPKGPPMNLPPRQQQILELVRERGYVSIEEMAQLFVVTPQTI
ncbi:MAG: DeoR family transcriptional regulator, partial [Pseudomonas alloputida]